MTAGPQTRTSLGTAKTHQLVRRSQRGARQRERAGGGGVERKLHVREGFDHYLEASASMGQELFRFVFQECVFRDTLCSGIPCS